MFDSHVHTKFSADSRMDIKDAVNKSREQQIGIILTEHCDFDFPKQGDMIFNFDKYFNEYEKYKSDSLLLGIEIGMQPQCLEQNRKVIEKYPFDYILGSIHTIYGMDAFDPETYKEFEKRDIYEKYFKFMLECLKCYDFIDSLGHIDYIARYSPYDDSEIYYEEFKDYIDLVLKVLAESGKAIELNTRRLIDKGARENLLKIFKRFYELGGRNITLGSDSHTPQNIGKYFSYAVEIANRANLKIVYYKKRKIII